MPNGSERELRSKKRSAQNSLEEISSRLAQKESTLAARKTKNLPRGRQDTGICTLRQWGCSKPVFATGRDALLGRLAENATVTSRHRAHQRAKGGSVLPTPPLDTEVPIPSLLQSSPYAGLEGCTRCGSKGTLIVSSESCASAASCT